MKGKLIGQEKDERLGENLIQEDMESVYACWLCNFPDIGNRQLCQLWELCGSAEEVYFASRARWGQVLSEKQVKSLVEYTENWKPREEYLRMCSQGIEFWGMWQQEYPVALKEIPDAPFGLFVRGRLPQDGAPAVAIIGARDCSEYGKYMARELGEALGRAGVTVVSGMARGIDGIAQEAALVAGGTSIAVLGSGVDVCYPSQNRALYEELLQKGAVVSSYPLGTPARPQNFPARNRIVSGLADAVIVIEARAKSGTLITVDTGLEQGKEIYAVPGRVTDRLSDGCNYLIKQGAGVVLSPKLFLEELWELWERKQRNDITAGIDKWEEPEKIRKAIRKYEGEEDKVTDIAQELPPELRAIYRVLDNTPKSVEEIGRALSGKYHNLQISTHLMRLCMEKKAIQVSPGQFCRV